MALATTRPKGNERSGSFCRNSSQSALCLGPNFIGSESLGRSSPLSVTNAAKARYIPRSTVVSARENLSEICGSRIACGRYLIHSLAMKLTPPILGTSSWGITIFRENTPSLVAFCAERALPLLDLGLSTWSRSSDSPLTVPLISFLPRFAHLVQPSTDCWRSDHNRRQY